MSQWKKTTWAEKLANAKGLPKVVKLEGKMGARWGLEKGGTMVVPAPLEVDGVMKQVPLGKVVTINEIRGRLARQHGTATACPLTTGIFAWIAAHAAEEAGEGGMPYWRTLKAGGEVNPKFPGGVAAGCRRLRAEGHRVVKKGARHFVADYERVLVDWS